MSILLLHSKFPARQRHFARARAYADEHGERLLLMMTNPTWERSYFHRVAEADTKHLDQTLAAVKQLADDETEPIRAIVNLTESGVPAAAHVANAFGLPSISERTAFLARDKHAMRQAYAAGGVAQPRFGVASSVAQALALAEDLGYPVVLKPIIGLGSSYVRSAADAGELTEHFEPIRRGAWDDFAYDPLHGEAHRRYRGGILVEEFVDGPEISVESLVVDGVTHSVAIHDKPLPTGPTFEEVYACTPTRLPAAVVDRVYAATRAVHRAMGITIGPTHVEFRLRDGVEPVILEAAARMGGGPIYRSVQLSTGVDMVEGILELACGRQPTIEPDPRPTPVGFYNMFPRRAGRLTAVHGLAEAAAHPNVDAVECYREIGEYLDVPPSAYHAHGYCIYTPDSIERLDETFAELTGILRLETE
jgi:biotin carboxylase